MPLEWILTTENDTIHSWYLVNNLLQSKRQPAQENISHPVQCRLEMCKIWACSWHTLGRRPRTFVAFLLIGVGWGGVGWGNNVHLHFLTYMMLRYCVGCVGVWWGNNVHLHFLTYLMLRYCMSSCSSSHTWCYATVCRLALPHIHDATLLYVVLHFLIHDATLLYVVLHFLTYMMLRYCLSSRTSSHIWCYATVCRLALPHHGDVKAMVNQWVFRQSLGPITPIAFLEELKQLLKQWGKKTMKCCFAVVWNNAKWGTSKNIEFFAENPISCHGRLSSVYLVHKALCRET